MPRGGKRTGRPGRAYENRGDLNAALPVQVAPSRQYGQGVAQAEAQRAVPMAPPPTVAPPAAEAGGRGQLAPGSFGDFGRPTDHPDEPITAGAPFGPGAGPSPMLGAPTDVDEIRAMYQQYPIEELRQILEEFDEGGF